VRSAALQAFRKVLPIIGVVAVTWTLWAVLRGHRPTLLLVGENIGGATLGAATGVSFYEVQKVVARRIRSRRSGS
jgi:hypothetical protein